MNGVLTAEAFYRLLLTLETVIEPAPLVAEAVEAMRFLSGARIGYVELFALDATRPPFRSFVSDRAPAPLERGVSTDIIGAVADAGRTLNLASAMLHPRFRRSKSVTDNGIQAVLCAPIGVGSPIGVVYLQGRRQPGRFPSVDCERAEHLAQRLASIALRIRSAGGSARATLDDELRSLENRAVRLALDRHLGNRSRAARELRITRARLYRILERDG